MVTLRDRNLQLKNHWSLLLCILRTFGKKRGIRLRKLLNVLAWTIARFLIRRCIRFGRPVKLVKCRMNMSRLVILSRWRCLIDRVMYRERLK